MKLCDYGCGQEGKFYFPTVDKWCCSPHWQSCPVKQEEHSIQIGKSWEDPNSGYNSILYKEKRSNIMKEAHKDPDSGLNSGSCKEKKSDKMKELHKNSDSVFNSISCRSKRKLTIEKIREKYPFFLKVEEMRYNPDKPEEKEIQVHCKNSNCLNSKEKGRWFTPTGAQISNRAIAIENPKGFGECNFYCSQECKDTYYLYNSRSDPLQLAEFEQYYRKVQKFTNLTLKYNSDKILNIELRGRKHGYDLDHKFSIIDGFNNDIDPKIIGHWRNLEVIKAFDNRVKSNRSSISIKEIQKIKRLSDDCV